MTEPCRTECGEQVTYEKTIFSDGIFFSIPIEKSGRVHNCSNIKNAEYDLEKKDNSLLTLMSEEGAKRQNQPLLNHEDRKKYRSAIHAIGFDVVWHLEDKLGFKEDREEMRRLIGYYLDKTFVHTKWEMNREEEKNLPIITRIIGDEFTYLELLGFLYQLDGFYADAKRCFEFMEQEYVTDAEDDLVKAQKDGVLPPEWGLPHSARINLMEDRIEQLEVRGEMADGTGTSGVKKIGDMWFDENWSEEWMDYFHAVEENQRKGDDTKSNNQSKTSLDADSINDLKKIKVEISDDEVMAKIRKFEKSALRPFVRKFFNSNEEMEKKLKSKKLGKESKKTLYDKALSIQSKEKHDTMKSEDKGVGLLRFLGISDLIFLLGYWPNYIIYRCLKDIANRRNKLAHPNVYDEIITKHTNNMVVAEIGICVRHFEMQTSYPSEYLSKD
tara:strand:+ start:26 stop:1348 length:1323 start_codon:yes stop_codon:yes gene_type:complete